MTPTLQTAAKLEVWQTLSGLHDAWTKLDEQALSGFYHKNMAATSPTGRLRLDRRDGCVAGWQGFIAQAKIHHWQDIDPRIRFYRNPAVVTYYFDISCEISG
jgi:hypothetical protein